MTQLLSNLLMVLCLPIRNLQSLLLTALIVPALIVPAQWAVAAKCRKGSSSICCRLTAGGSAEFIYGGASPAADTSSVSSCSRSCTASPT